MRLLSSVVSVVWVLVFSDGVVLGCMLVLVHCCYGWYFVVWVYVCC